MLLLNNADVKSNPGPRKKLTNFFSCCHWNANIILAHNKFSLLKIYNVIHKYDVLCISVTAIFQSIRPDHSNDIKQGSVCLYYKKSLKLRYVSTSYFSQCLLCQGTIC